MLGDGQRREDALATGHLDDADRGAGGRVGVRDVATVEVDGAADRVDQTADGLEQGRLARAVGAEQGDDLALSDLHVDAEQHLHAVVGHVDATAGQQCRAVPGRSLPAQPGGESEGVQRVLGVGADVLGDAAEQQPADDPVRSGRGESGTGADLVRDPADRDDQIKDPHAGKQSQRAGREGQCAHSRRRDHRLHRVVGSVEDAGREAGEGAEQHGQPQHRRGGRQEQPDADRDRGPAGPAHRLALVLGNPPRGQVAAQCNTDEPGDGKQAGNGAAAEVPDAVGLLEVQRRQEADRDEAGADERDREVLTAQAGNGQDDACGLAERRRLLLLRLLRGVGVVGAAAHRVLQLQRHQRETNHREEEHEERCPPAEDESDESRDERADDAAELLGVAVERDDTGPYVRLVVVGQQRHLDRVVDQPSDAVAESDQDEDRQGHGRTGQGGEDSSQDPADDHHERSRQPVTVVADRNCKRQHDRQVADHQQAEAAGAEVVRLLDIRRQHGECCRVELVEEEQR